MPQASPSRLCARCKVLELDDQAFGGRAVVDESGKRRLSFDIDGPKDYRESRGNRPLDYLLEDQLPDFPNLTASALEGCDFC